ncbi:MAG: hypothetical protein ACJ72P_12990 [Nocardioides sp.]
MACQVGDREAIVAGAGGDVDPSARLVHDVGRIRRERQRVALLQHRVRGGWRGSGEHQTGKQHREA